jgi:hypothetical protein
MTLRHKSIRVLPHERDLLVNMYLERRIPIEQYEHRSEELAAFVEEWNRLTGRTDTGAGLVHYMRTQRKQGLWVRFDGAHLAVPPAPDFSAEDIEVLVSIYADDVAAMGVGSDVLAYEDDLRALIEKEFADRTGRVVSGDDLVAKLTALRKRGLLPKAAELPAPDPNIGFGDIAQA